jgi:gluconate 2-dehydrogenase alpha chain
MAEQLKKTEVVLVGIGAAGALTAFALTQAGVNVTAIEAGGRLYGRDEKLNDLAGPGRFNIFGRPKANLEIPTWRPNASTPTIPGTAGARPTPMMNAVGGSSIHYATESWRLNPWNFKMRSETIKRYGLGAIPKGSTVADWPITYEELEPYYDKAEYEIGISGKAGNIQGKIDPAGNIFEGPRMREYPLPPLRSASWSEFIAGAARRLGWHPFPNPSSIHSQPWKGTPACTYCTSCGNGCFINAKGSTDIHVIPTAEKTKKLTIVTEARVTRIEVDNQGRASGVTYLKDGREYFQPASVVVLGSFTYEIVRLLLLSTSKAYPNGLSNNHGQVGKNYMAHNTAQTVEAWFPGRKLNKYGVALGTALDDWADDNFDHTGLGFIGGGMMRSSMGGGPGAAVPPGTPTWGSAWKSYVKANADSTGGANAQCDTLSYEDNYLDLDPTVRDKLGLPVLRITFDLKENDKRAAAYTAEKIAIWFKEAGAAVTTASPIRPVSLANHAYGGCRMGNDPETSVVDKWNMSHEVPNLGVLGASTFPTCGARNPTLTIQALAWRTGEHIAKEWKSIAV